MLWPPGRMPALEGACERVEKPLPLDIQTLRKVLVLRWGAMGDLAIASAVFEDLHRALGHVELHLNTEAPWDRLFRHDPRFARIITVNIRGKERGPRGTLRWLRAVRAEHYDMVIDLQCNDHSRLLLSLLLFSGAGIPYRISTHGGFPYNIAPPALQAHDHALSYLRAPLRALGIPVGTARPVLHPGPELREKAAAVMARQGLRAGRFALLMPGSSARGLSKRWGVDRYAELAARLHAAGLDRVVLIGGGDDVEECRLIERATGDWLVNLCGRTELLEVVYFSAAARCIVANDTGTAHLASATQTPMVIICGPTDARRVKPLGENVVAIQAGAEHIGRKNDRDWVAEITPEMVMDKLGF